MKEYFKKNYKFIIAILILLISLNIRFPYYIDAPGGIENMNKKIELKGYQSKGSFNITYVKEYKATILTLLISLFNKDFDVIKDSDVLLENENEKDYIHRDKMFMEESVSNAIYVAYKYAKKEIKIINTNTKVIYLDSNSNTDLKVGDNILEINGVKINTKDDITDLIGNYNIGDKLSIKVINNKKEYDRYANIVKIDGEKKLGILIVTLNEYETNPLVNVKIDENESGSSGGLIMALTIYNRLVKEDITKGLTIVGTGTIDINGNIGSIGGVEYKLKSAEKSKADIFFVPVGENYIDAIKLKEEKNYKIKIVSVSTFEEVLNYLDKIK